MYRICAISLSNRFSREISVIYGIFFLHILPYWLLARLNFLLNSLIGKILGKNSESITAIGSFRIIPESDARLGRLSGRGRAFEARVGPLWCIRSAYRSPSCVWGVCQGCRTFEALVGVRAFGELIEARRAFGVCAARGPQRRGVRWSAAWADVKRAVESVRIAGSSRGGRNVSFGSGDIFRIAQAPGERRPIACFSTCENVCQEGWTRPDAWRLTTPSADGRVLVRVL